MKHIGSCSHRLLHFVALTGLASACAPLFALVQVQQLTPSLTSPQPLGTTVTWTATATDTNSALGPLSYQFKAGMGGTFLSLRDFSLSNSFDFSPIQREGVYQMQVIARNLASGETGSLTVNFTVTSRLVGGQAAVNATAHPLVALFSAPPCPAGSFISVIFWQPTGTFTRTNWKACNPGVSNNFYLAGMRANQTDNTNYQVATGTNVTSGPKNLPFTAGALPTGITFPTITLPVAATAQADPTQTTILHDFLAPSFPVATDLSGNVIWYYPRGAANPTGENTLVTRLLPQGTMLLIANGVGASNPSQTLTQILRLIDLAGNTVRETNASRISEQLLAMGTDPITAIHHEAIVLPNGNTAIFGSVERIVPAGVQAAGPVDVLGDMVIVLDTNWQVVWFWNSFDYLDNTRKALLSETCANGQPGCPPVNLATIANDWTHSNSIFYQHLDGSLMISVRHQDWLVKIDYANGAGTKNILWRLGLGGDFAMSSGDPYPWFSHQHDAGFENGGNQILTLFDNGNTRRTVIPGANSRGQTLQIDEVNKTAGLLVNVDLGVFAFALGAAQRLPNGNYMYQPGIFPFGGFPTFSQTIEVFGGTTQVLNMQGPVSYRSWMLSSLYAPPLT